MQCSKCGKRAPKGQRYCLYHHAAYMREWRKSHKLTGLARIKAISRHYAQTYVRRGKIKRQPCDVCGSKKTQIHHADYSKPLHITWLCKTHHLELHKKIIQERRLAA